MFGAVNRNAVQNFRKKLASRLQDELLAAGGPLTDVIHRYFGNRSPNVCMQQIRRLRNFGRVQPDGQVRDADLLVEDILLFGVAWNRSVEIHDGSRVIRYRSPNFSAQRRIRLEDTGVYVIADECEESSYFKP